MDAGNISFPANGKNTRGYLAVPEGGQGPGVIVLQEWWGLVPHIEDVCNRFAKEGFVALAPDLFHGRTTKSPDEAEKLFMALNIDDTEKDLQGAVKYLLDHDAVTGTRAGVVGFCMGGQLALYTAGKNSSVGACVDFYGVHPNVHPDYASIPGPVLGFFGEKDAFVTPESVNALEKKFTDAGVEVDFHTYPGAQHAFFNDTRTEVYHAEAAADAWKRTVGHFRSRL